MTYLMQLTSLILFIAAASAALALYCRQLYLSFLDRHATPREPNPEPGPTMADVMAWGKKFEALGRRKVGGLSGLRIEREAILEALRLCRGELKAMRAERVAAGYDCDPSELDLKYAEFLDYTQRLDDVDRDIEEWKE